MRRPTALGTNSIPRRTPSTLRSGHSAPATTGTESETNDPEKNPNSRQKTTIPAEDFIPSQMSARTAATKVHGTRAFKGPDVSARKLGIWRIKST